MQTLTTQGVTMPKLGLGTFRLTGENCRRAVESALALGYRHIDTAEMYANEDAVGAALASSGVPRGEVFVTTKAWHDHLEPQTIARRSPRALTSCGSIMRISIWCTGRFPA